MIGIKKKMYDKIKKYDITEEKKLGWGGDENKHERSTVISIQGKGDIKKKR